MTRHPRITVLVFISSCLALGACSSQSAPAEPIEQIIVSKPGEEKRFDSGLASASANKATDSVAAAGAAAFVVCTGCHSAEKGAASAAGPNLYGIVGRKAAAVEGYDYSDALARSDIIWSEDELSAYLANPSAKVPGTTMVAGSVEDAQTRTEIIAYLASLSQ